MTSLRFYSLKNGRFLDYIFHSSKKDRGYPLSLIIREFLQFSFLLLQAWIYLSVLFFFPQNLLQLEQHYAYFNLIIFRENLAYQP